MDYAFNYVRTFRKRHGLFSEELAHLINQRAHASITFFESGDRVPNLEGALALQVVFGFAPREMFPGYFELVEDRVMRRAARLHAKLDGKTDRRSLARLGLLEEMAVRQQDDNRSDV
jgi:DNA-binding XRE family transcriptional regulator